METKRRVKCFQCIYKPPPGLSIRRAYAHGYTHAHTRYIWRMNNRMTRRRAALFTVEEYAAVTGLTVEQVEEIERSFLTDAQRAYVEGIQYKVGYYPRRKPKKRQLPQPQAINNDEG